MHCMNCASVQYTSSAGGTIGARHAAGSAPTMEVNDGVIEVVSEDEAVAPIG